MEPLQAVEGDPPVKTWREGAVAYIRFDRPASLNAIDERMASEFSAACERIQGDRAVRAVVLSGEGRAFMAGGDVAAMSADPPAVAQRLIDGMHQGIRILTGLAAPVIASVHGAVAGGGLGLVLACDLCIAAEQTRFTMAYPQLGTSSDCGTSWALPRLVGLRKALEMALLDEPIDAAEAQRLGLINKVVPKVELPAETSRLAQRLADGPTLALGRLKTLLRESSCRDLHAHLDAETQSFLASTRTSDFNEGVHAFLQKRRPRFTGQ